LVHVVEGRCRDRWGAIRGLSNAERGLVWVGKRAALEQQRDDCSGAG
jgi:hypothetical protein